MTKTSCGTIHGSPKRGFFQGGPATRVEETQFLSPNYASKTWWAESRVQNSNVSKKQKQVDGTRPKQKQQCKKQKRKNQSTNYYSFIAFLSKSNGRKRWGPWPPAQVEQEEITITLERLKSSRSSCTNVPKIRTYPTFCPFPLKRFTTFKNLPTALQASQPSLFVLPQKF